MERTIEEFELEQNFINRRSYQLLNYEEVYKNYNYTHDLEKALADSELNLVKLCNLIYKQSYDTQSFNDLYLEAMDMIGGSLDTEAIMLMKRCDEDKVLSIIHDNF